MIAAASRISERENDNKSFVQFISDNIDDNIWFFDGSELFKGWVLLLLHSSLKEITTLTRIHIKFYKYQSNSIRQVRYDVFERREIGNQSWKLDILSKDFWSLRFCGS